MINAFDAGWGVAPRVAQVYSTIDEYDYRIRYEPRLIDAIRDLHESGRAEVTWCSTWCHEADLLEEAFGLPPLPRAFTDPTSGPGSDPTSGPGSESASGPGSESASGPGSESASGPGFEQASGPGFELATETCSGPGSGPGSRSSFESSSGPGSDVCERKWAAARQVIASGRRLIWTDDVEVDHHRAEVPPGQALLINPDAGLGLRPAHVRRIRSFLDFSVRPHP
ncbi:hypothetical protein J3R03_005095 [Actinoplanes couchii]|uniref:hypothetical protein n=1 Tax=Actinoplanes couchii TaxID=403638 RepID=UPI00285FDB6E|nr:hypothetical protein [Actinoplanes couchii]MDR6320899.1 hypothetical protein [Actinoplanes couchii]